MQVLANLFVINLRSHFKHKKISPNRWFAVVPRHIARDPTIGFSYNFPDCKMTIRRIICACLGEFLCAKFEISLQAQENSAVGQESLSDKSRVTIR